MGEGNVDLNLPQSRDFQEGRDREQGQRAVVDSREKEEP